MKKFNIGDRVLWCQSPLYKEKFIPPHKCIVLNLTDRNRVHIEIIGILNTQGTNVRM